METENAQAEDRLWNIEDVAYYLQVSVHQARDYYRQGLPYIELGPKTHRFNPDSIKLWALAHEHHGAQTA